MIFLKKVYLTALHWAVKRDFYDIVKILVEAGSDLNAKDIVNN